MPLLARLRAWFSRTEAEPDTIYDAMRRGMEPHPPKRVTGAYQPDAPIPREFFRRDAQAHHGEDLEADLLDAHLADWRISTIESRERLTAARKAHFEWCLELGLVSRTGGA